MIHVDVARQCRLYAWKLLFLVVLSSLTPLFAQVITGTILGTVHDPSGSAVPDAVVRIRNTGTNVETEVRTNASGDYSAPNLPTGNYNVEVSATGFKTYVETAVAITLDSKVRININLSVGDVTESVKVVATAQRLQTDASDLNHSVSTQAIESLPNIGRNPLYYVVTTPGVVPRQGFESVTNFAVGDDSRKQFSNFTVNGSRPISSEILLDGAPDTNPAFNEASVLPSIDAIGDYKVITNAYSAEFGRAGGGVVSFGTKSGTNDYHGSLYDNFRNPAMNANSFGNNATGAKKGKFNVNDFGGTFAGPVVIPKLYNGRNKTFFFFSYEGVREAEDASAFLTMPTALERQGDFSQSMVQVRNPSTGLLEVVPRNVYAPFPSTTTVTQVGSNVRLERQQFQSGGVLNRIPASQLNPAALKFINLYPLPNITPLNPDGTLNYYDSNSTYNRLDQIIAKFDHYFTPQHHMFFRYTTDWTLNTPRNRFRTTDPQATDQAPASQFNWSTTVGHTWTVSSTSIVELRANLTRINLVLQPSSGLNADLAGLGFSQDMINVAPSGAFPRIAVGGAYQQIGIGNFVLRDNHSSNYAFTGSYTKIKGNWTLKFGGEYRPLYTNFYQAFVPSFAFSPNNFTTQCSGPGCPTLPYNVSQGFVLADLLIGNLNGQVGGGQFTTGDPRLALRNIYTGFYTQNDWKVSRSLTINLGVRWEYQGPLTERYNRLSQFNGGAKNATGTYGLYEFSGVGGNGRGQTDPDYRNLAPRVGFAWRLNDKTVIRSAYGISYDQITGVGSGAQGFGTDGFGNPAFQNIRPASGYDILARPFNDSFSGGGTILGANPNNPGYLGYTVTALDRHQRTPYIQQWNFTIERELGRGTSFQASYVGTKGTRMIVQQFPVNGNNAIAQSTLDSARAEYIATGVNPLTALVPNPFYGIAPASNASIGGPTISVLNLSKPFPAYQQVTEFQQRFGSSTYHSLQVAMRHSFSDGLEIGGNYVWSKSIDFGNSISVNSGNTGNGGGSSAFTVNNFALERSVSNSDIPHRAVAYWVYELPFGKGKRLLAGTPVISQVLGGWKVSGMATFSAGLPLAVTGGSGFGRPDLIGDPVLDKKYRVYGDGVTAYPLPDGTSIVVPKNRLLYFNPHAFSGRTLTVPVPGSANTQIVNDLYWYGTAPRFFSNLRGWGTNNWNMSIDRRFRIGERFAVAISAQAVNVFNRKEFADAGIDKGFGSANLVPANGLLGQSTSATFGTIDITQTGRTPRYLQLVARLTF
ncbi:MAG TPA: carboxypeptidase-like regulatory domain-containing protein [Bryobacteraceae bacterium]|nr:carboxypeptidase-like regulatory domain-containing protein [Bryobacteraceae bacterium]